MPVAYKEIELSVSDIECAVARYFNPRIHLIVPNISHGMCLHECDLLIMNGRNYGVEVEIKRTKADVKKDLQKRHGHNSNRIRRLFFAIPEYLNTPDVIELIPERAGIFVIKPKEKIEYPTYGGTSFYWRKPKCVVFRNAKINKNAKPFSDRERLEMGRLGMLRYWNIRNHKIDGYEVDTRNEID